MSRGRKIVEEDLCETLEELWDTKEGTQNRYQILKRDIEEVLDTQ